MGVADDAADAKVEAAKNDIAAVVFDEGNDFATPFEGRDVLDVIVDCRILGALLSVRQNFLHHRQVLKPHVSTGVYVALQVRNL